MAHHIDTGKAGELLGLAWLAENRFSIIEKNWRNSRWEIDAIARRDGVLHFIEIKTRRTRSFGMPEERVGQKKLQHMINAAEAYLYLNPQWQRIQFDILSILLLAEQPADYLLIEDISL
jgi:putative endonuclease